MRTPPPLVDAYSSPETPSISMPPPLVVARKGYYTDLAKWAAGKGYTHLRVDGEFLPTGNWPRLSRFQEHNIELPVTNGRIAKRLPGGGSRETTTPERTSRRCGPV